MMEVPRRIELMPVAPISKKETKKGTPPTIRFDLDLTEPTDNCCPEFNFLELLNAKQVSFSHFMQYLMYQLCILNTFFKTEDVRDFFCSKTMSVSPTCLTELAIKVVSFH